MNSLKKIMDKIFNLKVFFAIVCIVAVVAVVRIKMLSDAEQKKIEERRTNFTMESYESGKSVSVKKALEKCEISDGYIDGVVVGVDKDGEGILRYYLTDKEAITKVVNKINEIDLREMTEDAYDFVEDNEKWDIILYPTEQFFALRIFGQETADEEYYRTTVKAVEKKGFAADSLRYHKDLWEVFGSETQLLYGSDIDVFIEEIIDQYVTQISVDEVVDICVQEEIDLGRLFAFEHSVPEEGSIESNGNSQFGLQTAIYKFYIKDTETYLLIEKKNYVMDGYPQAGVLRVELYNATGECINVLDSDEDTIRAFIK